MSVTIRKRVWGTALACALGAMVSFTSSAQAGMIEFSGNGDRSTEGLGRFSAKLEYTASLSQGYGLLVATLTNTTEPANGGKITGFVFDIDSYFSSTRATLMSGATHPFENLSGNGLNAGPFGSFDAGAALGGSFLGGGSPNAGIGIGETGEFKFKVTGWDYLFLNVEDFFNNGDFVVRFRGMANEGSDMVAASVIPLPAPVALGLAGMALVVGFRRRIMPRG